MDTITGLTACSLPRATRSLRRIASGLRAWRRAAIAIFLLGCAAPTSAQLAPLIDVIQVAAGGFHVCALSSTGAVRCWGRNNYGQLGRGDRIDALTPVPVVGLGAGVTSIASGSNHTCARMTGGTVKCWGWNLVGQLGDGNTVTENDVPVDVIGLGGPVVEIAVGYAHTCAISGTGAVRCWGSNLDGQLGNNSNTNSAVPVTVSGLGSGALKIALGTYHSCALITGGGVQCWGKNSDGQLGNSTSVASLVPVPVTGLASGVQDIATGDSHSCAVVTANGVRCWGFGLLGQLGDGAGSSENVPVAVQGLGAEVVGIEAGEYFSCARSNTGAVNCWGDNGRGQLGDGTRVERRVPVGVAGLGSAVQSLSADAYGDNVDRSPRYCRPHSRGRERYMGVDAENNTSSGQGSEAMPAFLTPMKPPRASLACGHTSAYWLRA